MAKFTDKQIKALKAKEKTYDLREGTGEGFGIRVLPSGTKSWFTIYRRGQEKVRLSLGQYPAVSLAKARERHGEIRDLLKQGKDPSQLRRDKKAADSVDGLIDDYLERYAKAKKRTWQEDERILKKDVSSAWGKRKAYQVTRKDVIALVEKISKRGPIMANRTLACVRKMFRWAVSVGILEISPCQDIEAPGKEVRKDRVLTMEEIKKMWQGLSSANMSDEVKRILCLILVTAQRPGECAAICWEEIDFDGRWWTIPADKAKNGMAHRVYLTDLAMEILGCPGVGPVFPSPKNKNEDKAKERKPIHVNALAHAVRRSSDKFDLAKFTPHDLRRTAASRMTEAGIPRLTVAKILNHAENGVTAIYDRHSYDGEKRAALELWSKKLEGAIQGRRQDNVIPMVR